MADDDESDEPAVTLGEGTDVEGVPLAQVSARLMWGIERSAIEDREGETTIRTPDGPRELGDVLAEVESTYFATQQEFEDAIRSVIGRGPVPTPGAEPAADDGEPESEAGEGAEADGADADAADEGVEKEDGDAADRDDGDAADRDDGDAADEGGAGAESEDESQEE
jgi:hypothetical protein